MYTVVMDDLRQEGRAEAGMSEGRQARRRRDGWSKGSAE